jgi:hypothetical protein
MTIATNNQAPDQHQYKLIKKRPLKLFGDNITSLGTGRYFGKSEREESCKIK